MRKTALLILALFAVTLATGNAGLGLGWNTPNMIAGGISDWSLLLDSFPTWAAMMDSIAALSIDSVMYADSAGVANALNGKADSSVAADSSAFADSSAQSAHAYAADSSAFADSCAQAAHAYAADSSDEAAHSYVADSAGLAAFADSCRIAAYADSCRIAALADSARAAAYADSCRVAVTAESAVVAADAHTLQGNDSAYFARLNAANIFTGGTQTLKGTAACDFPTFGSELLTSAGWTVGDSWVESPNDVFRHKVGAVATLQHSATITNGAKYQFAWTPSATPAGTLTVSLGGQSYSMTDNYYMPTFGPTATSTAKLTITPSSDFNGTISLMSLKRVTAPSAPLVVMKSSNDTVGAQMRIFPYLYPAIGQSYSIYFGPEAGSYNTSAYHSVGIGARALQYNTSGYANTAVGYEALRYNTTGGMNTAVGVTALKANISGDLNVVVGQEGLLYNTSGSGNTVAGVQGMAMNTIGSRNQANGYAAAFSNVTGDSNSANGWCALNNNINGDCNTASGAWAGGYTAGGCGVGVADTAPRYCTFLGYNTQSATACDTNEIVVGANAVGAGSNTVTLGDTNVILTILRGAVRFPGSQQVRIDSMGYTAVDTSNIIFYFGGKSFTIPETP